MGLQLMIRTMSRAGNVAMRHSQTNAFTLIEMMTVIVIIGIILGAGIPIFHRISNAGGLSASTRQVANELALARQYAITQRTNTRVVFPYSQSTGGSPVVPYSMWYSSFAVLSSNRNPVAPAVTGWQYISKWEYLQVGSTFLNGTTTTGSLDNVSYIQAASVTLTNGLHTPTMAYIEFNPTGAATQAGTLTIQEGFVNAGVPTPTTTSNISTVSVDNLVGHISVNRP